MGEAQARAGRPEGGVTQVAFQSALARLVTDLDFRADVRGRGRAALPEGVSEVESERLLAAAGDRGLDAARTIYKGFRLSKLLLTLPLTNTLLGPERMTAEVSAFWEGRPPVSFYYVEEALAFCEHLLGRAGAGPRVPYLREVVCYERASLVLERARLAGERAGEQRVEFRHDPAALLSTLAAGRRPRKVPAARCVIAGRLSRRGAVSWRVVEG
ncbi:MAG TPA: hypothetical protein VF659_20495 [Pyrinomonadaceae bacterium]